MTENQDRLSELVSEALAQPSPEARERYLSAACGEDKELREQVDKLIKAHHEAGTFLLQPLLKPGANGAEVVEKPGMRVGRYKLLQPIGEGGFGLVFMAEQQEPVRRLVALKILKAGMDTKEVIARFEAERQALALMDHPNIARVLDGGTTASGRPYFVMDLVKGLPITDFCDQNQLSTEARLRLFMQVCAGVQHAHQKGIIHRDLKPSNVLVTLEQGQPVPKVIDFGIAKAMGQKLTERTLFTRFEQLIGTPAYMSPEQAEWGGIDIDTRSDIYSLGALLYELLTGTTPFEKDTLARAALDEVRRMIRDTEPPTPSLRLQALGQRLNEIAQRRRAEPPLLTRLVRGDLDWIVMKALEKDRARRYETANGLARDVERHLEGEPIVACPPSRTYRAGKFVRRHRVTVTAAAAVALAVTGGLVLALVGWHQARTERQRAEQKAAIIMHLSALMEGEAFGTQGPQDAGQVQAIQSKLLDREATAVTNSPMMELALHLALGRAYAVSGEPRLALPEVQKALQISPAWNGLSHNVTLACLEDLSKVHGALGAWADCLGDCRELAQSLANQRDAQLDSLLNAAAAALLAGDIPAYQEFARNALAITIGSTDLGKARNTVLCGLALKDALADPGPVFQLADMCRTGGAGRDHYGETVQGLAEYRRGHLDEALRWLDEPCRCASSHVGAMAGYLCAMVHCQQGEAQAAHADLAEANKRLDAFLRAGDLRIGMWGRRGASWVGYGYAVALRAEAEHLLLGRVVSPVVDASWLESSRRRWAPVSRNLAEGDRLAGEGRWLQARADYLAAVSEPVFDWETAADLDRELPMRMGVVLLLAKDVASHERLCRAWFARLHAHPDPNIGFLAAKTALAASIDPDSELGREATGWLQKMEWSPVSEACVRAMAAYRAGRYEEAVAEATRCEDSAFSGEDRTVAVFGEASTAQVFRAMALARLERRREAEQVLEKTEVVVASAKSRYMGKMWWDLGLCRLGLEEAHQLFRQLAPSATVSVKRQAESLAP